MKPKEKTKQTEEWIQVQVKQSVTLSKKHDFSFWDHKTSLLSSREQNNHPALVGQDQHDREGRGGRRHQTIRTPKLSQLWPHSEVETFRVSWFLQQWGNHKP